MAKSKVPVARIEGADGAPGAQDRQSNAGNGVPAPLKTGSTSAVVADPTVAENDHQPAATTAAPHEVSSDAPASQTSASDEQAAAKPTQEKKGERPRMKVVAEPVLEMPVEGGRSSVSDAEARVMYADESVAHDAATQPAAESRAEATEAPQGRLAWLTSIFTGHSYAALGGVCGLVVALLVFFVGFWKTLFVCLLVLVGVAFGQYLDGDPKIVNRIRELVVEARGNN